MDPVISADPLVELCDGGEPTLELSAGAAQVRITDRASGRVFPPAGYTLDGARVRRRRGVWPRGRRRLQVEHLAAQAPEPLARCEACEQDFATEAGLRQHLARGQAHADRPNRSSA